MRKCSISPAEALRMFRTIAVVGASGDPGKEANAVPLYMRAHGYRVVPINPSADRVMDVTAYPSLLDLPREVVESIDIVEVFGSSEELPTIASQAIQMKKLHGTPYAFWAQLGLFSEEAAGMLLRAGIYYVMDECMRTVYISAIGR